MDMKRMMSQLQNQFAAAEAKMKTLEVDGEAGGDEGVYLKMTGKFEVKELKINFLPKDEEDLKLLQDLIIAALKKATDKVEEEIKKLTAQR